MKKTLMLGALACAFGTSAVAAPFVQFYLSGSSGDWTLDFEVTNNLGVNNLDIYFFGVQLESRNIVGSPPNWDPNAWTTWDNSPYGGSNTIYNNNWIIFGGPDMIQNGETLNGFKAKSSNAGTPANVKWFAFAYDWTGGGAVYGGNDYFNADWNPGFEGVANIVPEPVTISALAAGLGLAALRRRKK